MGLVDVLLIIVLIYVISYFYAWLEDKFFSTYKQTPFGFKGKLVYSDQGKLSKLFINKVWGLAAKPDFIYQLVDGSYVLIEYKSRKGRVHQSDIWQTISSVIAVRPYYPISDAYIFTETIKLRIDVTPDDAELYSVIEKECDLTRKIKAGSKVTTCYKQEYKCRSCSMQKKCEYV